MTLILSVDTLPNTSTDFPGYPLSFSFQYLPRSAPVPNHFPVAPRGSARYNCVYFVPRNSLQSLLNPVRLPIPPCPRDFILDFHQLADDRGSPVSAQFDISGDVAGSAGLRRTGWSVSRCRSLGALRLDEQALAPHGQAGAAGHLRHGVSVLPGDDRVRSLPEFPPERAGRGLT